MRRLSFRARTRPAGGSRCWAMPASRPNELPIDELKKLVKAQPEDVVARVWLAEALDREGRAAEAAVAYEAALKISPSLAAPPLKLAELYAGPAGEYGKGARVGTESA